MTKRGDMTRQVLEFLQAHGPVTSRDIQCLYVANNLEDNDAKKRSWARCTLSRLGSRGLAESRQCDDVRPDAAPRTGPYVVWSLTGAGGEFLKAL